MDDPSIRSMQKKAEPGCAIQSTSTSWELRSTMADESRMTKTNSSYQRVSSKEWYWSEWRCELHSQRHGSITATERLMFTLCSPGSWPRLFVQKRWIRKINTSDLGSQGTRHMQRQSHLTQSEHGYSHYSLHVIEKSRLVCTILVFHRYSSSGIYFAPGAENVEVSESFCQSVIENWNQILIRLTYPRSLWNTSAACRAGLTTFSHNFGILWSKHFFCHLAMPRLYPMPEAFGLHDNWISAKCDNCWVRKASTDPTVIKTSLKATSRALKRRHPAHFFSSGRPTYTLESISPEAFLSRVGRQRQEDKNMRFSVRHSSFCLGCKAWCRRVVVAVMASQLMMPASYCGTLNELCMPLTSSWAAPVRDAIFKVMDATAASIQDKLPKPFAHLWHGYCIHNSTQKNIQSQDETLWSVRLDVCELKFPTQYEDTNLCRNSELSFTVLHTRKVFPSNNCSNNWASCQPTLYPPLLNQFATSLLTLLKNSSTNGFLSARVL